MKSTLRFLLLLAGFAAVFSACIVINDDDDDDPIIVGSGVIVTETRTATGYDRILISGPISLTFSQGNSADLIVKGDDNLIQYVETTVQNGRLVVSIKNNTQLRTAHLEVVLQAPQLTSIELSGSGNVKSAGDFAFGDLSLTLSGTGNFNIDGTAKDLVVQLLGAGNFSLDELVAQNATVRLVGTGSVAVHTDGVLNIHLDGTGNICYVGNPSEIKKSINGVGTLTTC